MNATLTATKSNINIYSTEAGSTNPFAWVNKMSNISATTPAVTPLKTSSVDSTANIQSNPELRKALETANPELLRKLDMIDTRLLDHIGTTANQLGVDPKLIIASIYAETGGYAAEEMSSKVSPAGAKGLNQIMDVTYKHVMDLIDQGVAKLPPGVSKESLANYTTDPKSNVIVSTLYLKHVVIPEAQKQQDFDMKNMTAANIGLVLGMYNRGPYKAPDATVATNVGTVKSANNSETRNHVVKTTNMANKLILAA